MALTKEQVANRSLALLGADPITTFEDDNSTEAQFCALLWDGLIEDLLTVKPWRFAMKQETLDRLVAEPAGRWEAAYQLPSDLLRLQAITLNDNTIHYDRYDDMAYCNAGEDDILVADYIYKAEPAMWMPYFTNAVVLKFAAILGGALARDAALVEKYDEMGEKALTRAANIEAQSQTTRRIKMNRYLAARGNDRSGGGFRDDGY
jgi:hypothetical protein